MDSEGSQNPPSGQGAGFPPAKPGGYEDMWIGVDPAGGESCSAIVMVIDPGNPETRRFVQIDEGDLTPRELEALYSPFGECAT